MLILLRQSCQRCVNFFPSNAVEKFLFCLNDDFIWHFTIGCRLRSTTWCESNLTVPFPTTTKASDYDWRSSAIFSWVVNAFVFALLYDVCLFKWFAYANVHWVPLAHMWHTETKDSLICADDEAKQTETMKLKRFCCGGKEDKDLWRATQYCSAASNVRLLVTLNIHANSYLRSFGNDEQMETILLSIYLLRLKKFCKIVQGRFELPEAAAATTCHELEHISHADHRKNVNYELWKVLINIFAAFKVFLLLQVLTSAFFIE